MPAPRVVVVITVLCGGVGAAKMLAALSLAVDERTICGIVNTGDDLTMHGLRICPDIDTITYTLAGLNNNELGWGLADETWRVMDELGALGGDNWFRLGDRDLATHLYRSQRLAEGASLSLVTAELLARRGVRLALLPVSEDPLATVFSTRDRGRLSFQEYFVRERHAVVVEAVDVRGADLATPAPGVLDTIREAERIVISPSNPLISIAPILAVPGVRSALAARRDDVIAVSPLIGGRALKGPADRLLEELGHGATNAAIASIYSGIVGTLVIDRADAADEEGIVATGVRCLIADTLMDGAERSKALARLLLDA